MMDEDLHMDVEDQVLDSWTIHNRILLYLLNAVPAEALASVSLSKERSVGQMFAHIHNVRLMWLKAASTLGEGLEKIESPKPNSVTHDMIRVGLAASEAAIATLVQSGLQGGRIKGFKPHPGAFYSYLIAHEWYHVGEIGITLTQAGFPLDQKTAYGLWEWGSR